MRVYKEEKFLEDQITVAKSTASLLIPAKLEDKKEDLFIENLENIAKNGCDNQKVKKSLAKIAEFDHPELMYGSAILVSTIMNRNDDLFLPEETWSAKNTAVNIPYNDDHIETDIIGHTIAVRPLNSEGKLIEGNEPPDYFDLEIDFVMYQGIFPTLAKTILEQAPLGQKFVSLEAKFKEFDYGLVDSLNKVKIVARNEETAFLTKYLRGYGGEGVYQNYRMARVLRDFRFSGIANVDNPANPGSEYTKFDDVILASQSEVIEDSRTVIYVTKGKVMEIKTLEDAQKLIAELNEKLSKYEGKEADAVKAELETVKNSNTELSDKLTAEQGKVAVATQQINDLNAKLEDLNKKVDEIAAERDAKAAELDKIQKEAKVSARVAQLKELGLEVSDEKRKEITEWSDAIFASVVEFTKSVKPNTQVNKSDETANASNALENAQPDKDADVTNTSGDNVSESDKIQKIAAKVVEKLRSGRNKGPKSSKKE